MVSRTRAPGSFELRRAGCDRAQQCPPASQLEESTGESSQLPRSGGHQSWTQSRCQHARSPL